MPSALRWPALAGRDALVVWALLLAVVGGLLGPALAPGVVVAYDMPWSPSPRLTPFALGIGTPAPRAVPGDAVVAVLGMALGASVAQKIVLVGVLIAAGVGVGALVATLVPHASVGAHAVAVVAAVWNPFVVERLTIGQWTILLGYALVPWALLGVHRVATGGGILAVLVVVAVAGAGGANTWLLAVVIVLVGLLSRGTGIRAIGWSMVVACGSAAVWALPSVLASVAGDPAGLTAFAPHADTPFGVLASLLSGGGIWNQAAHPPVRMEPLIAAAATLLGLVGGGLGLLIWWRRCRPLFAAVLAPTLLLLVSVLPATRPLWIALADLPGAGLLRDSHKLIAPWVITGSVGLAALVTRWRLSARLQPAAGPLTVGVALLTVLVLPTAAWGVGGRIGATHVPDDLVAGAATLSEAQPALVGVLPWNQYRRYAWNDSRISLTLAPRMVDQVMLYDDALPLREGIVGGEDARARAVSIAIASGTPPIEALVDAGVGYLVVERETGLPEPALSDLAAAGRILSESPHLVIVEVAGPIEAEPRLSMSGPLRAGWLITLTTWAVLVAVLACRAGRALRNRPAALLRSPP